jgi:hypothetical protein
VLPRIRINGKDEPITFLPWLLMHDPRYVAKGAMQRGIGVSLVDLDDSPSKLGVIFNS